MTDSMRPSGDHEPQAQQPYQPYSVRPGSPADPSYPYASFAAAPPVPPAPPGPAGTGTRRRARGRGPVALVAAVAIAAAALGAGTAALVGNATEKSGGGTATPVVNANATTGGSVSAVAQAVGPSIVEIKASSGQGESTGSGVIITGDGEIITNNHVIAGADSVKVTFSDGSSKTASVVGTDPGKDLALIKVRGASGLKAATLGDSDSVRVGDQVVAIGSPEGLTGTVTSGIVSALDRDVTVSTDESQGRQQGGGSGGWPFEFGGGRYNGDVGSSTTTYKAIQTDASLNPGNSGGALINMKGQIIGINSAMYSPSGAQASGSAGSVGLGFAIPVETVTADLDALRDGGS
ncbi:S1C family serine protease [Streptomyces sp. P1-3]|uniref:S1C family serine protease n=1 Tax=Streptomyces sp. P1-3 TaxID=3421658 RepID=UPI003D35DEB2